MLQSGSSAGISNVQYVSWVNLASWVLTFGHLNAQGVYDYEVVLRNIQ